MILRNRLGLALVAVIGLSSACGDNGPTGSSDIPSARTGATSPPSYSLGGTSEIGANDEDFSCADVDAVRARFSSPGFVQGESVGFYVFFSGVPQGPKRLRIWWDYESDPAVFQDHRFSEDETVLEEVYPHHYSGLSGPTEMLVRVELIRDGLTGNCARNRAVVVTPPGAPSGPAGPVAPVTQTANVGPPISAVSGTGFGSEGVTFTVSTALTIDSVWVNPGGSGTLVISLMDSSGSTVLNTTSVAVGAGAQQVALGFSVSPGSYVLCATGPSLGATLTLFAATYPYTISGVISLTDSVFGLGAFFGYYYYLYNWQVTW